MDKVKSFFVWIFWTKITVIASVLIPIVIAFRLDIYKLIEKCINKEVINIDYIYWPLILITIVLSIAAKLSDEKKKDKLEEENNKLKEDRKNNNIKSDNLKVENDKLKTVITMINNNAMSNMFRDIVYKQTDRVTYFRFAKDNKFENRHRFSPNPVHNIVKNKMIPCTGIVGEVWRSGNDYYTHKITPKKLKECCHDTRMKSKSYYATIIKVNGKNNGILVIESEEEKRYLEDDLKIFIKSVHDAFIDYITALDNHDLPDIGFALSKGV